MRQSRAGSVVILVATAFGIGHCSADTSPDTSSNTQPKPAPTKTVTVEKVVTKERTKRVEVNRMPGQCRDAVALAAKIGQAAVPLINSSGKALDIMSDAHQAITSSDGATLNSLRSKMYQLDGEQAKSTLDLSVYLMPSFKKSLGECQDLTK